MVEMGLLTKLGYGVYGKMMMTRYSDKPILANGLLVMVRETMTKLNVFWLLSNAELDYNAGKTTQVPLNPPSRIKSRFRRKLTH